MQFARDLFIDFAARVAISLHLVKPPPESRVSMPAPAPGRREGHAKRSIENNLAKTWFLAVIASIAMSVILLFASGFIAGGLKPGFAAATFLWAVLFGWFFTFFVQAKVVSAVFGALFGSGAHNAVTGSGFVTAIQGHVEKVTKALGFLSSGSLSPTDQHFIAAMVWMFFVLLALLCLPAFFRD